MPDALSTSTVATLEPGGHALSARWGYDPTDPYAVTLLLRVRDGWVPWRFDRELLSAGLAAPAGHGDIHLEPFPTGHALLCALNSPNGNALLRLHADDAAELLAASYRRVPLGAEHHHIDWDLEVELLRIEEDT